MENELKIYQNIFKEFTGKTIISAIHSLHLLRHFDYIYMFKGSRIIGEGNFLVIQQNGYFKALWESYQSESKEKEESGY